MVDRILIKEWGFKRGLIEGEKKGRLAELEYIKKEICKDFINVNNIHIQEKEFPQFNKTQLIEKEQQNKAYRNVIKGINDRVKVLGGKP